MLRTLRIAIGPYAEAVNTIKSDPNYLVLFISKAHPKYILLTKKEKDILRNPLIMGSKKDSLLGTLLGFISPGATEISVDSSLDFIHSLHTEVFKMHPLTHIAYITAEVLREEDVKQAIKLYEGLTEEWTNTIVNAIGNDDYYVSFTISRTPSKSYIISLMKTPWSKRRTLYKYVKELRNDIFNTGSSLLVNELDTNSSSQKVFNKWLLFRGNAVRRLLCERSDTMSESEARTLERTLIRDCPPLDKKVI